MPYSVITAALVSAFVRGNGRLKFPRLWLVLFLISCLAAPGSKLIAGFPLYYPPYSESELLEAEEELRIIVVMGKYRLDHLPPAHVDIIEVPDGRISEYCGYKAASKAVACQSGRTIYLSRRSNMTDYYHELGHIRGAYLENRSHEEEYHHIGWIRNSLY